MPRDWQQLLSDEDALPMVREWVAASANDVNVLPVAEQDARRALQALQVTTRSPMGALAFHTGGLLIDHGWLRVLGGGSAQLPRALDLWNRAAGSERCEQGVLIADDVVGGFHAWFREPRTVHYLAPDTLEWEDSELGYSDWLQWCLSDRLAQFYADLRWDGWREEVSVVSGAAGLMIYPPLFTDSQPIGARHRGVVPVEELWRLALDFKAQLGSLPEGAKARFEVKP